MSTTLFLRTSTNNRSGLPGRLDLLSTRGSGVATAVVNTVASGTEVQWTQTAGGQPLEWVSAPVGVAFTLATTDVITFNVWALENSMNANVGARARLYNQKFNSEVTGGPWNDGVEFNTVSGVMNWTGSPTANVVFEPGDRILLRLFITNVGTMASGFTATLNYNGAIASGDGESFITITPTVTFDDEPSQSGILARFGALPAHNASLVAGFPFAPRHAYVFNTQCLPGSRIIDHGSAGRHATIQNDGRELPDSIPNGVLFLSISDRAEIPDSRFVLPRKAATVVIGCQVSYWKNGGRFFGVVGSTSAGDCYVRMDAPENGAAVANGSWLYGGQNIQFTNLNLSTDCVVAFSAGPRGLDVWKDGAKVTSASTAPSFTAQSDVFRINGASSFANGMIAKYGFFYVYDYQLTPAQLQQVTRAPF